jgi:phosphatidylglycerol---prolipoprotein diacylglyceryl transferase
MNYPHIDPILLQLGPLSIHWYGVMYLLAFALAWLLAWWRAGRRSDYDYSNEHISDLIFFGAIGAVLGGRIGYVLFYNFPVYMHAPLEILKVWQGGMSFHGGLVGAILGLAWCAHQQKRTFFDVADFIAPHVPLGLGLGRLGNFINGELWGAPTTLPWGMVFPHVDAQARHPSQLYQFLLEGIVLFIILWWFSARPRPRMAVSGLFLLLYGFLRLLVEFVREPDSHLGYLAWGWVTMGQILSLPMILAGAGLLFWAYRCVAPAHSHSASH